MNCFFYDDNGKIFLDKQEALKHSRNIKLYYYDKEFMMVDWKKEPVESLQELYRQRAERIRDENEYVILAYSGGIDSTTILETFYYNNIHIDEILLVGALNEDSSYGADDNHNAELYANCWPTLNKMNLPNTKITTWDYTKLFHKPQNFTLYNDYDWIKKLGVWYSVHSWWWHDAEKYFNTGSKKTALVMGMDKPNYLYDTLLQKGKTWFTDFNILSYGSSTDEFNLIRPFKKVYFYWHPDSEKIIRKQLHLIHSFYQENVLKKKVISNAKFLEDFVDIRDKLIYNLRNPLVYKSPKTVSKIISLKDKYFLNKKTSDIFHHYAKGVSRLDKTITNTGIHTRYYYIQ